MYDVRCLYERAFLWRYAIADAEPNSTKVVYAKIRVYGSGLGLPLPLRLLVIHTTQI